MNELEIAVAAADTIRKAETATLVQELLNRGWEGHTRTRNNKERLMLLEPRRDGGT